MDPSDLEKINLQLEGESSLKEKIKEHITELDKKTRIMAGALNKIHSTPHDAIPDLLTSVRATLQGLPAVTEAIASAVPEQQFWKWKDLWTNSLRAAVYAAVLVEYLDSGALLSIQGVVDVLGIKSEWQSRFQLPPEDYLHGLISMVNELSRYAVNAVTLGDYEQPIRISAFVKDIFAGFSVLDLKNDLLRRRFDSLKYDMKKIEEVVYDVSLRRLAGPKVVTNDDAALSIAES